MQKYSDTADSGMHGTHVHVVLYVHSETHIILNTETKGAIGLSFWTATSNRLGGACISIPRTLPTIEFKIRRNGVGRLSRPGFTAYQKLRALGILVIWCGCKLKNTNGAYGLRDAFVYNLQAHRASMWSLSLI